MRIAALLVLSILPGSLPLQSHAIAGVVTRALASSGAPGASVAIVKGNAIVYEGGFGVRSIGGPPVDVNTRFEIGSITKQFTAAAILQLKERRKLSLDDRLSKFLPSFPHAREVTLLQLLQQTSGMPDYMEVNHFLAISHSTPGSLTKIERMASGALHFAPGSQWEYSNTNYIALGRVIEVTSGERYDSYVRRHLFKAADMQHSAALSDEPATTDMASGYWRGMHMRGPLQPAPTMLEEWTWSAGDIISTAGDLARWVIALRNGKIISKADYTFMTTPARLTTGVRDDYAFHWWTDPLRGHRLFSGLGDTYGSSSCDDVFPEDNLAIIVLENSAVTRDGRSDAAAGVATSLFDAIVAARQ